MEEVYLVNSKLIGTIGNLNHETWSGGKSHKVPLDHTDNEPVNSGLLLTCVGNILTVRIKGKHNDNIGFSLDVLK